ncbi:class F sortase [Terrabacter sp. NPDC080008]|uniref:class F sortase n=1 Tax=Terrabacter sp. NPDC080008 TaxID=3155176 RepID=UPI00344B2511
MRARTTPARVAAAVAAALVAGLLVLWVTRPQQGDAAALSAAMRGSAATATTAAQPTTPAATATAPAVTAPTVGATEAGLPSPDPAAAPPTGLTISAVGLRMPVVPVGVATDGDMALPHSPAQAGWYRFGALPGDPQGATVIAGHLDEPWYGTGPLGRLADVSAGDSVVVTTGSTSHRYVVTEVQAVRKTRLDLAALFRTDGPPSLHLVTCGGRFDPVRRSYDENVVVVARPA